MSKAITINVKTNLSNGEIIENYVTRNNNKLIQNNLRSTLKRYSTFINKSFFELKEQN